LTGQFIARVLLAGLCGLQGLGTLAVDLNRAHATNPEWPGHARFHLVWQAAAFAWLALLEIVLIFGGGPFQEQRFYLAAILAGLPMLGFFTAFIGRRIYRGTLSDPNGIPPANLTIMNWHRRVDLSLVAETGVAFVLAAIIALYRHSSVAR
jgi:hypothetical protein